MASSRNLANNLLSHTESALLGQVRPGDRLVLGLSGGIDSVVLLHLLDTLAPRLGYALSALHVNHRISPHAASWAEFCQRCCAARHVPLDVVKVELQGRHGLGVEAAARQARYAAYARQNAEFIVLAHHVDDQAETMLLQLLRGAGVKGLSAMPEVRARNALRYLRPLLEVPRAALLEYAQAHALEWVDDESNLDIHYDRNFLRREIFPVLGQRFPAYRKTMLRASRHFAEAARLLDVLAELDAGEDFRSGHLAVATLRNLDPLRAKNLLRHFLAVNEVALPSAERIGEILRQLTGAAQDAQVRIEVGEHEVRRFADKVYLVEKSCIPVERLVCTWQGETLLALPGLRQEIAFQPAVGAGISRARLQAAPVEVRLRQGGESLRPDCKRPRRSLKKLWQESHIPPWERERLPILFCGNELVWVPGIGIDCAFQAAPGEAGVAPVLRGILSAR